MKKTVKHAILAIITGLVLSLFCSCAFNGRESEKDVTGRYILKSCTYKGVNLDNFKDSFIVVTSDSSGLRATLRIEIDDTYCEMMGYLQEKSQTSDRIDYSYWIKSETGNLFNINSESIPLSYKPSEKEFSFPVGTTAVFYFKK